MDCLHPSIDSWTARSKLETDQTQVPSLCPSLAGASHCPELCGSVKQYQLQVDFCHFSIACGPHPVTTNIAAPYCTLPEVSSQLYASPLILVKLKDKFCQESPWRDRCFSLLPLKSTILAREIGGRERKRGRLRCFTVFLIKNNNLGVEKTPYRPKRIFKTS